MIGTMTIDIPDEVARGLERIAAAQKQSVEELAVERLKELIDRPTSPEVLLRTLRALPHPSREAVDDLDAAITSGRLPVTGGGPFDENAAN